MVREKEQFVKDIAAFRARMGAGGGVVSTGSAQAAQEAAIADLESNVEITRAGAVMRSAARGMSADALRTEGTGALVQGVAGAVAAGFENVSRRQARGR